jgi:hypothetical protein
MNEERHRQKREQMLQTLRYAKSLVAPIMQWDGKEGNKQEDAIAAHNT